MTPMKLCFNTKVLALSLLLVMTGPHLSAAERSTINITGYVIDAQLDPSDHTLKATARVTFTATDTTSAAVFELHNALKVDSVTDSQKHPLDGERGPNATISVALPSPMRKGASATLTFVYEGTLSGSEESPVEGLKVASIGDPISYLLYAGRWFPMVGYLTDRFTAEIHVQIPEGYRVVGSGNTGSPRQVAGGTEYTFNWTRPSFPGTIIAGKFNEPMVVAGSPNVRIYVTDAHKQSGPELAQTANKEFEFFGETFGESSTRLLNVVELPDDTLPSYWAPEIAAIAGAQ
jgi:aminopeptidase N